MVVSQPQRQHQQIAIVVLMGEISKCYNNYEILQESCHTVFLHFKLLTDCFSKVILGGKTISKTIKHSSNYYEQVWRENVENS